MNSKSDTTGRTPLGKRRNDESIGKQNMTVSFETTPLLQLFEPTPDDYQEPPTQDEPDLEDDHAFPVLMHRDSDFTIGSAYSDEDVHNDLSMWRGSLLITAEMMGTGLLALPFAIHTLGTVWGIGFLILNLPINWYAGWILHQTAAFVERQQAKENAQFSLERLHLGGLTTTTSTTNSNHTNNSNNHMAMNQNTMTSVMTNLSMEYSVYTHHTQIHHDTATFDFIGITDAVFQSKALTRLVMTIYYTNIFLVLGDYILVMSHAVTAMVGEDKLCIPQAGILASTLMYGVAQIRTMVSN